MKCNQYIVCIVACQDGFIKLSIRTSKHDKNKDSPKLFTKVYNTQMNGPVSCLRIYQTPTIELLYSDQSIDSLDSINDEQPMDVTLSLCVGMCVGYCVVFDNILKEGLSTQSCHFLKKHVASSFLLENQRLSSACGDNSSATGLNFNVGLGLGCCDSVLCCSTQVIHGNVYVLFGFYSGKLVCYQHLFGEDNSLLSDEKGVVSIGETNKFEFVFECQFDQQIHKLLWLNVIQPQTQTTECKQDFANLCQMYKRLVVITLYQIHILPLKRRKEILVIDWENAVSV
ncbi:hypothetical protein RFI_07256 [Reticulomyxa filosa]|uniref:Uncharacterized protein n=1 Tax=Reticulomyxa filosa TaxID=46433 RepID=X6NV54_RETFI|nr:hypothetical protein RFI_07256 [Reticulomyxa filosa]|eukprot:ETO29866.1 hypothetical protein RFI_07256 [Reticulomyxa filosa]